jgi:hypothetical protein
MAAIGTSVRTNAAQLARDGGGWRVIASDFGA